MAPYTDKNIKNIDFNSQSAYWEFYLMTKIIPDWLLYFKNILNITYSILSYRLIIKTFGLKSSSKGESFLKKLLNKFTLVKSKSKQVEKARIWACNITNIKFLLTLISLYFGIIKIMFLNSLENSILMMSNNLFNNFNNLSLVLDIQRAFFCIKVRGHIVCPESGISDTTRTMPITLCL